MRVRVPLSFCEIMSLCVDSHDHGRKKVQLCSSPPRALRTSSCSGDDVRSYSDGEWDRW
jgi:hypothetical protein